MNFDISTLALGWIADYGAPMVAGLLYIGALGIPVPGTLLVVASGAFIRQNLLDISTPPIAYLGTIAGDASLYAIGYFARGWIQRKFGHTATWKNASDFFEKRGGVAIFLTRWLLTAIAFPITLIAGTSGYRFQKFFILAMLGELTWFALYGGLGYAFGSQWELISEFMSNFSGFILGAVVLMAGVYLFIKSGKKQPA